MPTVSTQIPEDPFALFRDWLAEAEQKEDTYPNAMTLATADVNGQPSARVMLLKGLDENGFVFYTNSESRKGREIADNPQAALCFYWKSLKKQVRVEGRLEEVTAAEADAYFATRPRGSRIGAWASQQSRPLDERSTFDAAVEKYTAEFEGREDIPRPPYWKGFRVIPKRIEFWQEGDFRLHTRHIYTRTSATDPWTIRMAYP